MKGRPPPGSSPPGIGFGSWGVGGAASAAGPSQGAAPSAAVAPAAAPSSVRRPSARCRQRACAHQGPGGALGGGAAAPAAGPGSWSLEAVRRHRGAPFPVPGGSRPTADGRPAPRGAGRRRRRRGAARSGAGDEGARERPAARGPRRPQAPPGSSLPPPPRPPPPPPLVVSPPGAGKERSRTEATRQRAAGRPAPLPSPAAWRRGSPPRRLPEQRVPLREIAPPAPIEVPRSRACDYPPNENRCARDKVSSVDRAGGLTRTGAAPRRCSRLPRAASRSCARPGRAGRPGSAGPAPAPPAGRSGPAILGGGAQRRPGPPPTRPPHPARPRRTCATMVLRPPDRGRTAYRQVNGSVAVGTTQAVAEPRPAPRRRSRGCAGEVPGSGSVGGRLVGEPVATRRPNQWVLQQPGQSAEWKPLGRPHRGPRAPQRSARGSRKPGRTSSPSRRRRSPGAARRRPGR